MKTILAIGDTAPGIHATDVWGKEINMLSKGQWTYLSFHRFAACPFCNLRTNDLIRHYPTLKKNNIEVISIWPSEKDKLLQYVGKRKSPFLMLSDPDRNIYKAYGVTQSSYVGAGRLLLHPNIIFNAIKNMHKKIEVDADPKLMPAGFLVDTHGIIQMAYYGKHFGDHPEIESILQYVIFATYT